MPRSRTTGIRLDDEIRDGLQKVADADGRKLANLLVSVLEDWFKGGGVGVSLDPQVLDGLKALAKKDRRTLPNLITTIVEDWWYRQLDRKVKQTRSVVIE